MSWINLNVKLKAASRTMDALLAGLQEREDDRQQRDKAIDDTGLIDPRQLRGLGDDDGLLAKRRRIEPIGSRAAGWGLGWARFTETIEGSVNEWEFASGNGAARVSLARPDGIGNPFHGGWGIYAVLPIAKDQFLVLLYGYGIGSGAGFYITGSYLSGRGARNDLVTVATNGLRRGSPTEGGVVNENPSVANTYPAEFPDGFNDGWLYEVVGLTVSGESYEWESVHISKQTGYVYPGLPVPGTEDLFDIEQGLTGQTLTTTVEILQFTATVWHGIYNQGVVIGQGSCSVVPVSSSLAAWAAESFGKPIENVPQVDPTNPVFTTGANGSQLFPVENGFVVANVEDTTLVARHGSPIVYFPENVPPYTPEYAIPSGIPYEHLYAYQESLTPAFSTEWLQLVPGAASYTAAISAQRIGYSSTSGSASLQPKIIPVGFGEGGDGTWRALVSFPFGANWASYLLALGQTLA